jgi:integrase
MSEAQLPRRGAELARRRADRKEMLDLLALHRPQVRGSRVRGSVSAGDLARVVAFVATGDGKDIWANDAVARRNWLLVCLLVYCGLRQGEVRQLKVTDVDLSACVLSVERRHDDPGDPRIKEPNAKTYDRRIPFLPSLAEVIEAYILGPGSDAAARRGSPFLLLTHDNRTFGTPISDSVAAEAVADLGRRLDIDRLTPHHLRRAWIQDLASWASRNGVSAADFERFANMLGGWSRLSKMASEYRGDQLTEAAFKAGLLIQERR